MTSGNGNAPAGFRMPESVLALEFPADSTYHGAVVRCRRLFSLRRALALRALADGDEPGDIEAAVALFGAEILLDWNLLDADGTPIPCTPETFAEQPAEFVTVILSTWIAEATGVAAPLAVASPAGGPAAAASTTRGS